MKHQRLFGSTGWRQSSAGSIMLLGMLLLLSMLVGLPAQANVLQTFISDDFNNYSPGALAVGGTNYWSTVGVSPNPTIVNTGSAQYLSLTNSTTSSSYFGKAYGKQQSKLSAEFDLNIPMATANSSVIMYDGTSINGGNVVFRLTASAGNILIYNGGGSSSVKVVNGYSTSAWYHFKINFDTPQKTFAVTVTNTSNGGETVFETPTGTSYGFYSSAAVSVGTIAFLPGNASGIANALNVDNVQVYVPNLQSVTVSGPSVVATAIGKTSTAAYTTVVRDVYGHTDASSGVVWELYDGNNQNPLASNSITINSSGVLTVSGATLPQAVTVRAVLSSNPSVTGTRQVLIDNAALASLDIGGQVLTPAFDPDIMIYSTTSTQDSVTVIPIADMPGGVSITVNGKPALSGEEQSIALQSGINTITVQVASTAYPAVSRTYTVKVTQISLVANVIGLTATPGVGKATFTWTEPNDPLFATVNLYLNGAGVPAVTVNKGTTTVTLEGLDNGTAYTVLVKTAANDGTEGTGISAMVTPGIYAVKGIALSATELVLQPGQTALLTAAITPVHAANPTVIWSSTRNSVAQVNAGGSVTAVASGEAYIIASTPDGSVMAAAHIVVESRSAQDVRNAFVTTGDNSLTLTWEDPLDPSIFAIRIYAVDPVHVTSTLLHTVERGIETYAAGEITNGNTYFYTIKGVKADGSETEGVRLFGTPPVSLGLENVILKGYTTSGQVKTLVPEQTFNGIDLSYSVTVTNDVYAVAAIPYAVDPANASLIVNGSAVANGQVSPSFNYSAGAYDNLGITVSNKVTPTFNKTYNFRIYRQSATDHLLSSLALSEGTINFLPKTLTYSNIVEDYDTRTIVLTPTAVNPNDSITINGNVVTDGQPYALHLPEGSSTVTVSVYNSTSASQYSLSFNRYSRDQLKSIEIDQGTASRDFRPDQFIYYIDVPSSQSSISLTPNVFDPASFVTVNGKLVTNGTTSDPIPLSEGDNAVLVSVNNTVTYTVYVYRLPSSPDDYLYTRDEGATVTVRNKYISLTIDKATSNMIDLHLPGEVSVMNNGLGYFLGNPVYTDASTGKQVTLAFSFSLIDDQYHITNTPEMTEIWFTHDLDPASGPIQYELHYVLRKDEAGPYVYMSGYSNPDAPAAPGKTNWGFGQTRWSIRGDTEKFPYTISQGNTEATRFVHPGVVTDRAFLIDSVWRMPDGTIMTKYSHGEYENETHVYGDFGDTYGLWFIRGSSDYINGLPTAQEIGSHMTNTTPILNWTPSSGHYGRGLPGVPSGYKKVWGPMLVYLNKQSSSPDSAFQEALNKVAQETEKAPYSWISDADYQSAARGNVQGCLTISDGTSAQDTTVILADPNTDWQQSYSSYNYSVKADANGNFSITNVMPGTYRIYAYKEGLFEQFKAEDTITVSPHSVLDVGQVVWTVEAFGTKLWQIGTPDRTGGEYLHGDQYRTFGWHLQYPFEIPNGVQFTIGESDEKTDWEYAQLPSMTPGTRDVLLAQMNDKPSVWTVNFQVNQLPVTNEGMLTIAVAASRAPQLKIWLNDTVIQEYKYNDAAIQPDDSAYIRAGHQGIYKLLQIPFDASLLKQGHNTLKLDYNRTMYNNGTRITDVGSAIVYDSIKMEVKDAPGTPDGLLAVSGDGKVTLAWNKISGANTYNVHRSGAIDGPFSLIASSVETTAYTDTGLANGNTTRSE